MRRVGQNVGMIVATYETEGPDANVLVVGELPDPVPGAGEVLVRVAVSGVNPTDWKTRTIGGPTRLSGRIVPHQDGAGTITAIGDGVDPGRVGERVWLYDAQWQRHHGTAAQLIALPSARAVPLPDSVSFALGAGLGIPYMTAHRCLFADGPLAPGTPVLVHGGAGAVGHAAIELARWDGARVATTVSSAEKAGLAREAGAELVVNYHTEDVVAAVRAWTPAGVSRIVEVNLPINLGVNTEVLAPGGTIVCYTAGGEVSLPRVLMALNARLAFVLVYTIPDEAKAVAVEAISRALRDGAITALPLHHFELAQIADAHGAVEAGALGKVLIDIP